MINELIIFSLKLLLFLLILGGFFGVILASLKQSQHNKSELEIESLNKKFEDWIYSFKELTLPSKEFKKELKKEFKAKKNEIKNNKEKPHLFVITFDGDIKASEVKNLRQEISALVQMANPHKDEVLCLITSPGGMVQEYGHGAAQLLRLKENQIKLTVAVDTVAASGGYLMACVGSSLLASPFAILGSIGVLAQVPNFHRLLKNWDIDYKEYTAGEYKKTVSLFGEIQPKGEEKFLNQLESTHSFFKTFVKENRPGLDIQTLGTGEYWYGQEALKLGLVDKIQTSDAYILEKIKEGFEVYSLRYFEKLNWQDRIQFKIQSLAESLGIKLLSLFKKFAP